MSDKRIGVLLVQESHLSAERLASVQSLYERNLTIFSSAHPSAPSQKEGVAVIINKKLVSSEGATAKTVVEGRAIQVSLKCMGDDRIHLLCIYAPTSDGVEERRRFFNKVQSCNNSVAKPDLMVGDFNNVEDAIDRLPINESADMSVDDLDQLKLSLGLMLVDGWRETNPTSRGYTFHRGQGENATFSRLDRIYVRDPAFRLAREWKIAESGIKTDHLMVAVQLTTVNAPKAGRGRPIFPLSLIRDKKLAEAMKNRGMKAMTNLESFETGATPRSESDNPQKILWNLKKEWLAMARDREKEVISKLLAEIKQREDELKRLQQIPDMD
ncbi:DNase I-like protein, partial [Dichomitus squalens LYAD-421 SS1]|uniref:DNase I-like protein n=1 Tax=Dichomitus squalens (strain LYAD-421) TaxID=732165 RepID=UPI0004410B70